MLLNVLWQLTVVSVSAALHDGSWRGDALLITCTKDGIELIAVIQGHVCLGLSWQHTDPRGGPKYGLV